MTKQSNLKNNTYLHHLQFIKHDLLRILVLFGIPIISIIFFPVVFFLIFSTIIFPSSILWIILPLTICFGVSFVYQLKSSQLPDYKPDLKASLLFTLYLILLNALAEEIFFRGFLLNILLLVFKSPVIAIILSAAIFGYYHIPLFKWDFQKAAFAALGGIAFCLIYYYSNSLLITWLAHAAADLGLVHEGLIGYFVWTRIRHKEIVS